MQVSINIPSYRRPVVKSLELVPMAKVWVCETEAEEYKKENPNANIIAVPSHVQGNLCRIRNYILDREFENGMDVVAIIDDDISRIGYWQGVSSSKKNKNTHFLMGEEVPNMILNKSRLVREWGAYFWGININPDQQCYRSYSPFSTKSYIGGPFQVFLKGGKLRYDESLPLKEDYDMTLQQLNKHRIAIRFNKYFYEAKQSAQTGGCATYRNREREMSQLRDLQKKWGDKIVKIDINDRSHSKKKKTVHIDYNPVIRVPIKGI